MKGQAQTGYVSLPHQTGVTERSIGRNDGHATHHVIE
jgi:hypothetical protein